LTSNKQFEECLRLIRHRPTKFIGLDFETFGDVNLPAFGLDNYVNGGLFQPLIASVAEYGNNTKTFDFIRYGEEAIRSFRQFVLDALSWGAWFTAHNVGFERAVLEHMGFGDEVLCRITDSAVAARAMGAASHLEAAAPQLTSINKLETGRDLIMLFSVPNELNGGKPMTWDQIKADKNLRKKWEDFVEYCEVDAFASLMITQLWAARTPFMREHELEWYTYLMNRQGWNVDTNLVREMKLRYEHNSAQLSSDFLVKHGIENDKFLNSTPQMKAWCDERGIKTTSFDAEHIEKLWTRINKQLTKMNPKSKWWQGYHDVLDLLQTKRELGGSSLSKLQKILDLVSSDGQLRNQYMHLGAGQSYRTTGKGVQLQNLKRLSQEPLDFDEDPDAMTDIDNSTMAENLRQVFYSLMPDGRQVVGDFSSVENRMLAWVAGDDAKIAAFKAGKDMYKHQATLIYGVRYDDVTKPQRQVGKVGELGCGYGAGPGAITRFAGKMGIDMTEEEALNLVRNWRSTNPLVVELWDRIGSAAQQAVSLNATIEVDLAHGLKLVFETFDAPPSLAKQHPGVQSLRMSLYGDRGADFILERVFQGVYMRGTDVCFYKPSDRKTGDLWSNHYRDPKTGKIVFYKVYGGKLTGILIQSLCREMFFDSMQLLFKVLSEVPNATLIGQFHDELVVSWWPFTGIGGRTLQQVESLMSAAMSMTRYSLQGFPLQADIKNDYRYTK
jgi:DNA polymerase